MEDDAVGRALRPFWDRPPTSGVFSDFDGTLAPIVADPAAARAAPGAVEVLTGLVTRLGRVGIVSGRPASFLIEHLGGRGLYISGLYGLETVVPGGAGAVLLAEASVWAPVVEEVAGTAEAGGPDGVPPGVGVERKGLALTLHYRSDPTLAGPARRWAEDAGARSGLVAHEARMAVELRPPVVANKGTALLAAAGGLEQVCFIGDDFADLDAFDALDTLAASGAGVLRVAVASDEGPPSLVERADLVTAGVPGAVGLLERLLAGL